MEYQDYRDLFTPSVGPGPFFTFALVDDESANTVEPGSLGALTLEGTVFDGSGNPVPGPDALIEILQGDQFARMITDDEGRYRFIVRKPERTILPDGREEAPYFHVRIFIFPLMEAHETRVYFSDEGASNDVDPVLQYVDRVDRGTMVAIVDANTAAWDIRLSGPGQTAFLAPVGEPSILDAGNIPTKPYEELSTI